MQLGSSLVMVLEPSFRVPSHRKVAVGLAVFEINLHFK